MNQLILKLSDLEFIKIIPEHDITIQKMYISDSVLIYFCDREKELCIGKGVISQIFDSFIFCLKKALKNQLQLHKSLTQDLGVMCNEYLRDASGFVMESIVDDSGETWVGANYEICFVCDQIIHSYAITWLYNDQNNNIIFEAFALYTWSFFKDDPMDKNFITYDEFIKNYTSLCKKTIPHAIAMIWLKQIKKWYKICDENEKLAARSCSLQEKKGSKNIIFPISSDTFFKIISDDNLDFENVFLCSNITVTFECKNKNVFTVGKDIAGEIFRSLVLHLEKAVENKLQLHESLHQNLGYLYNEYFDNTPPDTMMTTTQNGINKYWVIYDYELWSARDNKNYNLKSWLYNDGNGDIIFEISKIYPWFYTQKDDIEKSDFIYYEDFIKDYKSVFCSVISDDIAILWLEDAKKWLSIFSINEKHCRKEVFILKNNN